MNLQLLLAALALAVAPLEPMPATPSLDGPGEAQATAPRVAPATDDESEDEAEGGLFVEGVVHYRTDYYFRGFNLRDRGLTIQPEITLGYAFASADGVTVTPYVNLWGNLTDDRYDRVDYVDEVDVTAGVEWTAGRFTVGVQYLYYASPSDGFADTQDLGVSLGFDDAGVTSLPVALNPYIAVYRELSNPDRDGHGATYGEIGIEPAYDWPDAPVTLAFPVKMGVSLDRFYEHADGGNDFVGYVSAGIVAQYAIGEHWFAVAGVEYLCLLSDDTRDANGGDRHDWVATVGVGFSY